MLSRMGIEWRLLAVALLTAAAVAWVWLVWRPADPVRTKFDIIRAGMTRDDVELIMGEPGAINENAEGVILYFQANGAVANVIISHETGTAVKKSWHLSAPESDWVLVWRWVTGF